VHVRSHIPSTFVVQLASLLFSVVQPPTYRPLLSIPSPSLVLGNLRTHPTIDHNFTSTSAWGRAHFQPLGQDNNRFSTWGRRATGPTSTSYLSRTARAATARQIVHRGPTHTRHRHRHTRTIILITELPTTRILKDHLARYYTTSATRMSTTRLAPVLQGRLSMEAEDRPLMAACYHRDMRHMATPTNTQEARHHSRHLRLPL